MNLSKDLISQFVKATKDATTVKKESTVYGTVVKYNEKTYVKIDGSDLLTPAETLSSVEDGERVSIMIKDHTATITGNYTAPSASSIKVDGMDADLKANTASIKNLVAKNAEIENLVASKATIDDLQAANAEIDTLKSNYAEIETLVAGKASIGDLEAVNADIKSLKADKADIAHLEANYATIGSLNAVYADVTRLEANKADITDLNATNAVIEELKANKANISDLEANYATIKQLDATNANVTNLQAETANINKALIDKANVSDLTATNANISNLQATKADITDLNAANANINTLTGNLADITTLVNGNLTSDNIQSMVITGDKFTVADAFIKDAMIDSVSANKINAGVINTNNVSIQSDDGSMLLQGNLQQFKDKNGKVRIQIGKDATGNFTFVLYDENGTGQLINQNGIQSSNAIADGLIVDAKVADNANIAGSKLDIDSVVTEVNNGTTSIKGTKIYLDDQKQSLNVAFNNMSTTVKGNTNTIESHTTSINTMNGKVTQLISDTTITKQDGTTTSLKDAYNATVDTVDSHSTKIGSLETNLATANNNISSVSSKQSALEQNLNGFKQTVSQTYATKTSVTDVSNNLKNNYSTTSAMNSAIEQKANEITSSVSETYATKASLTTVDNKFADYSTTSDMNSAINQKANEITSTVSETYATKTSLKATDDKFANYSTTSAMNSAINQKANEITSTVSETYTTKADFNNLSIGGTNLLSSRNILKNNNLSGNDGTNIGIYVDYHCNKDFIKVESGIEYYIKINNPDTSLRYCIIEKVITYNNGRYVSQIVLNNRASTITIPSNANQIKIVFKITGGANYDIVTKYKIKVEKGNKPTDWSPCPDDIDNAIVTVDNKFTNYSTTSQMNSAINQKANEITSSVSETYATKASLTTVDNKFANYSTTSAMNSAINQKANEITSTVSETYATKTSVTDLSNNLQNNYSTTSAMNSAIQQKANEITSTVSETYTTKSEFNDLSIGGRNLLVGCGGFTKDSPLAATSNYKDGYKEYSNIYTSINLEAGEYMIQAKTDGNWATSHDTSGSNPQDKKCSLWLYRKKADGASTGHKFFDMTNNPIKINITASDKYYLRLNTYSDGLTNITVKFWDIKLEKGNKATDWTPAPEDVDDSITAIDNKFVNYSTTTQMNSAINQKANEITSTVSETYATKTSVQDVSNNLKNNYSTTSAMNSAINQKANEITSTVSETYATKTSVTDLSNNLTNNYSTTSAMNSAIEQKANEITSTVSETYATKTLLKATDDKFANYSTTSDMNSAIQQKANEITSTVSETYATKTSVTDVSNNLKNNYSTTSAMNSAINQKSDAILSTVSSSYVTKTDFNNLEIGGRNLLRKADLAAARTTASFDATSNTWTLTATAGNTDKWGCGLNIVNRNVKTPYGKTCMISFEIFSPRAVTVNWDVNSIPISGSAWNGNDNDTFSKRRGSSKSIPANQWTKCWFSYINNDERNTNKLDLFDNSKFGVVMTSETSDLTFKIRNVKAEIGTTPTAWTPAPEDIDSAISAVDNKFTNYSTTSQMNSAINQKANEITSSVSETYATKASLTTVDNKFANYSTTSAMNSAINQKANEITSTVSETYATKTSVTDVSNNLKNNYSTTSAMNSAINQKANEITSTVSKTYATKTDFNNLQVGGTNLLPKSGNFKDNTGLWHVNGGAISVTLDSSVTYGGYSTIKIVGATGAYYNAFIQLKPNTTYTYSVLAKASKNIAGGNTNPLHMWVSTTQNSAHLEILITNNSSIGTKWTKAWVTFKTPNDADAYYMKPFIYQIGDATVWLANAKIEEGNKATDWSPAQADIDASITAVDNKFNNYSTTSQMNSAINQKANEITSTVSSLDTKFTTNYANTVISSSTEFYLSTSNTTQINGSWSDVPSDVSQGTFLWSRTKNTKGNGSISYTEPICVTDDTSDGYIIVLSRENQTIYCDANGNPI